MLLHIYSIGMIFPIFNLVYFIQLSHQTQKLSKLTKIVSFRIIQCRNVEEDKLNTFDAHNFSQLILIDTPSTLRSADLCFYYNHFQLPTRSIVPTNLTHLRIIFYETLIHISIEEKFRVS